MRAVISPLLSIAVVILFCLSPATASAGKQDFPPMTEQEIREMTPLQDVVRRNWERWSQGAGMLGRMDLIARMADPAFQGEDAAALVALAAYARKHPVLDLATATAVDEQRIVDIYRHNIVKLRRAQRVLFANGKPTFTLLQQGPPGDCYFFSATGWMAKNRPEEIMKAITSLPDGRFRVRFANGDQATVSPPTDSELALNDADSTLQDGLWMSVLEKAWID